MERRRIAGAMRAGHGRRGKRVEKSRRAEHRLWTPTLRTYRVVEILDVYVLSAIVFNGIIRHVDCTLIIT
jgi:hypothetical protein